RSGRGGPSRALPERSRCLNDRLDSRGVRTAIGAISLEIVQVAVSLVAAAIALRPANHPQRIHVVLLTLDQFHFRSPARTAPAWSLIYTDILGCQLFRCI